MEELNYIYSTDDEHERDMRETIYYAKEFDPKIDELMEKSHQRPFQRSPTLKKLPTKRQVTTRRTNGHKKCPRVDHKLMSHKRRRAEFKNRIADE